MIGLLTEGLRSTTQKSLITQGLASSVSSFVANLILFCPPVFSLLLIQNNQGSLQKIDNLVTRLELINNSKLSLQQINNLASSFDQINNLKLLLSYCDDN